MRDEQVIEDRREVLQEFLASPEARILLLGSVMLVAWVVVVAALWQFGHPLWVHALGVSFTTLFVGKPAAVAHALQAGLRPSMVVFLATYVDAVTVYIAYPVLVFSYRRLFERRPLQKHMQRVFDSAQKSVSRFRRYKIAGVFVFVWIPVAMTGVVVGAVLGYLLGLKHWVAMVTVTVSTFVASICWTLAYDRIFGWLSGIHKSLAAVATAVIIGGIVVRRIVVMRRQRVDEVEGEDAEGDADA